MLYWSVLFLVIAIISGILGFTGVAVAATGIAKVLFFIFLLLFIVTLVINIIKGKNNPPPV